MESQQCAIKVDLQLEKPQHTSIHRGFINWKMKDDYQKSSLSLWQLIPNLFFIAPLPNLVLCKTKGAAGAVCAIVYEEDAM
jgi:hypothetical protein